MPTRRGMVPEDLYRITFTEDAQIAPDGRRVAFVRKHLDAETDAYRSQIWVAPCDAGEPASFTTGNRQDNLPRWSPDGRWLAFLSDREGDKKQIWVMPADGGEARRLTQQAEGVEYLAWSPDSTQIAFVTRTTEWPEATRNGSAPNQQHEPRRPTRIITDLKYKANGEGFVHDRRRHIFIISTNPVSAKTGEIRQLTGGPYDDEAPAWAPDGSAIAFSSARHADRAFDTVSDIFLVPASGGEARRLTSGLGPAHHPAFAPDGRTIAYLGHDDPHAGGARNTGLWSVERDGGAPRNLTPALDRTLLAESPPIWLAGGNELAVGVVDQGTIAVRTVAATGGVMRTLAAGQRLIASWSLSADGSRLALTASTPVRPGDVYLAETGGASDDAIGTKERQLTDLNADWLAEVVLSEPERFSYTSVDGWEIEGWCMRPGAATPNHPSPLLLNVHGGPHMYYGWGFLDEFQVQAGAGYAVLYTNPRGSQGYGAAFAQACCGDWGGKDYEDVMNGLDAALARFDALDPQRLGVLGGSYGGFMTSWIVGHSRRFQVAVSERAVNALGSLFGTSDIGYFFEAYEIGGTPLNAREFYAERSPLTYADRVTTPLLILHSENDLRCPIEQAEQFYVALKLQRQTEVVFVRFPDETHELSRSGRPSRRVERFQIILDWLDRYLMPRDLPAPRSQELRQAMSAAE